MLAPAICRFVDGLGRDNGKLYRQVRCTRVRRSINGGRRRAKGGLIGASDQQRREVLNNIFGGKMFEVSRYVPKYFLNKVLFR